MHHGIGHMSGGGQHLPYGQHHPHPHPHNTTPLWITPPSPGTEPPLPPPDNSPPPPPQHTYLNCVQGRAVHILLDCILVLIAYYIKSHLEHKMKYKRRNRNPTKLIFVYVDQDRFPTVRSRAAESHSLVHAPYTHTHTHTHTIICRVIIVVVRDSSHWHKFECEKVNLSSRVRVWVHHLSSAKYHLQLPRRMMNSNSNSAVFESREGTSLPDGLTGNPISETKTDKHRLPVYRIVWRGSY